MIRKLSCLTALAVSLSMAPVALLHADEGKMGGGGWLQKLVDQLGVSPDQQTKIKAVRDAAKATLKTQYQAMRDVRKTINEDFKAGTVDAAKIDGYVSQ